MNRWINVQEFESQNSTINKDRTFRWYIFMYSIDF